jgi:hypothetical protein
MTSTTLITCLALFRITPILKTSPKYSTQECKIAKVTINDTNYDLTKINDITIRSVVLVSVKSLQCYSFFIAIVGAFK